jgi:hypothetical protein
VYKNMKEFIKVKRKEGDIERNKKGEIYELKGI